MVPVPVSRKRIRKTSSEPAPQAPPARPPEKPPRKPSTPRPPLFPARFTGRPALISIALIAVVLWVGRYWNLRGFGLYEDDLFRITIILDWPWMQLLAWMREIAFNGNFGRMLHEVLIYILAKAGWDIGGLSAMHLMGFCILLLNSILFFLLLRRMDMPSFPAVFGSMVFVLFPPDSTQVFLTHAFGIHPGVTCFLIGSHLLLAGRPLLGLIAVIPALFIYESVYLLFLAIPLVALARKSMSWRKAAFYIGLASAVFGLLTYLRLTTGDSRSVEAAGRLEDLLPVIARNVFTGPFLCLRWTFTLPGEAMPDLLFRAPAFLASGLLSGGVLWWLWKRDSPSAAAVPARNGFRDNLPLQYLLIGVALLFLSYPLLFELNPVFIVGRNSRVHLAAVVGASLVLASVVWLSQRKLSTPRAAAPMVVVLAIFCGLMTLHAFRVQDDFRRVWRYQQGLWTDIIRQSPDIAPGTLVLAPTGELVRNAGFWPWPWEQTRLAEFFYRFPPGGTPPRLFFMKNDWERWVSLTGDLFEGVQLHVFGRDSLDQHAGKPIHFYRVINGELRRLEGPLRVGDYQFELAPPPPAGTQPAYEKAALWDLFVRPAGAPPVDYFAEDEP